MEGAAAAANVRAVAAAANVRTPRASTVTAGVPRPVAEAEEEENEEDDDEGPFFDMEFTVRDDGDGEDEYDGDGSSVETDEETRFGYAVSAGGSDRNLGCSPSDDLFFKGKLLPVDQSEAPSPNSRPPQFPVSLLRSATKIRVFLLGFKKPKPPVGKTGPAGSPQKQQQSRLFTVKLKVEEVPIVSLFTRENSSRSSTRKSERRQAAGDGGGGVSASDARRFAKVVMQKYLKVIKPLYVRASRRYGDKVRFSGQLSPTSTATIPEDAAPAPANVKSQKQGNLPAGLRVACRHLGKSRSASAAVAAMPAMTLQSQSQRRDDSLLQQQDGIQSAIAHCKRSFNASSTGTKNKIANIHVAS